MRTTKMIQDSAAGVALFRVGEDRLEEFVYATYNMFRKTLGVQFDLAPDYLDRMSASCYRYFERMFLVGVVKGGHFRGSGTAIRVDRGGGFEDIFYDYGFAQGDLPGYQGGPVFLLTRLVLDREDLTVEERWRALQMMQGAVFSFCFRDSTATIIGLPDAPRMTKLYARMGIHWRLVSEPLPFPGIDGYHTCRCVLKYEDLTGDALARLEPNEAFHAAVLNHMSAGPAKRSHRFMDNPKPEAARLADLEAGSVKRGVGNGE